MEVRPPPGLCPVLTRPVPVLSRPVPVLSRPVPVLSPARSRVNPARSRADPSRPMSLFRQLALEAERARLELLATTADVRASAVQAELDQQRVAAKRLAAKHGPSLTHTRGCAPTRAHPTPVAVLPLCRRGARKEPCRGQQAAGGDLGQLRGPHHRLPPRPGRDPDQRGGSARRPNRPSEWGPGRVVAPMASKHRQRAASPPLVFSSESSMYSCEHI